VYIIVNRLFLRIKLKEKSVVDILMISGNTTLLPLLLAIGKFLVVFFGGVFWGYLSLTETQNLKLGRPFEEQC
jgi:hypothetical protein